MKPFIYPVFSLFLAVFIAVYFSLPVFAEFCDPSCSNLDECKDKISKCREAWDSMESAKKPHIDSLKKMEADITAFQARIKVIEADVVKKTRAIAEGEDILGDHVVLALQRIRQFYIRQHTDSKTASLLGTADIGQILRLSAYERAITSQDKKTIAQTASSVRELEDRKKALEKEKAGLAYIKEETDRRAESVRKLVSEAEAYQSKVTGIIASLSTQQQALLAARSGTFTTSVGDVPLADDPNASSAYDPGFRPAFAGFSFGAYTHRKGMSQYGAKGRANSGQNYREILRAYYGKEPVGKDTGGDIQVVGFGSLNFEDRYLMGIAEMPADFPAEALKAQAVAARTYAWRYKTSGQAICTTQSCQVYSATKAANPPPEWRRAVEETRGQIIEDVVTYYSSTTGGYLSTTGWDTKCGNQGCWTGDAYEKIAASPWFYKGWYTSDYYNSSAKCGRSHPWLTSEELADILNAWQHRKNGGDASRILPVTINSCPISGATGNPYSMGELRDLGGFTGVSGVSVSYNSGGYTDTVTLQTNKGAVSISGSEFKEAFNLRAPGYISIRSPLFNIEKK